VKLASVIRGQITWMPKHCNAGVTMTSAPSGALQSDGQALSPTERSIVELWIGVLDIPRAPSLDENFFALGGDSNAMLTIEFQLNDMYSIELAAGALIKAPTVRSLSVLVDEAIRSARGESSRA